MNLQVQKDLWSDTWTHYYHVHHLLWSLKQSTQAWLMDLLSSTEAVAPDVKGVAELWQMEYLAFMHR